MDCKKRSYFWMMLTNSFTPTMSHRTVHAMPRALMPVLSARAPHRSPQTSISSSGSREQIQLHEIPLSVATEIRTSIYYGRLQINDILVSINGDNWLWYHWVVAYHNLVCVWRFFISHFSEREEYTVSFPRVQMCMYIWDYLKLQTTLFHKHGVQFPIHSHKRNVHCIQKR